MSDEREELLRRAQVLISQCNAGDWYFCLVALRQWLVDYEAVVSSDAQGGEYVDR